jgi:hypothetical protein
MSARRSGRTRSVGRCASEPAEVDAAIERALEGKKRADFVATYKVWRRFSLPTRPEQLAQTVSLLGGRQPRTYAQYVADVVHRSGVPQVQAV